MARFIADARKSDSDPFPVTLYSGGSEKAARQAVITAGAALAVAKVPYVVTTRYHEGEDIRAYGNAGALVILRVWER